MSPSHHGTSKGYRHQEPLYDTDIPTPSHAERAHTLAANVGTASLCTLTQSIPDADFEADGIPYGSFVTYGLNCGNPVLLISTLAEHTRNLLGDPRTSLLIAESGEGDPLARARVTLVGRAEQLTSENNADRKSVV